MNHQFNQREMSVYDVVTDSPKALAKTYVFRILNNKFMSLLIERLHHNEFHIFATEEEAIEATMKELNRKVTTDDI